MGCKMINRRKIDGSVQAIGVIYSHEKECFLYRNAND